MLSRAPEERGGLLGGKEIVVRHGSSIVAVSTTNTTWDAEGFIAALRDFQGIWADRDDIDEIHADLKRRELERLSDPWGDRLGDEPA